MRTHGNERDRIRLIVSGGIGSGKSTVLRMLRGHGVYIIETDRIGHDVLEPDGPAYDSVSATWPAVVRDGRIDRSRLAAIVFTDPGALEKLESLSHPHIASEIERRVEEARELDIAIELPVNSNLVGPGWTRLVVETPEDLRLRRAVGRGMGEADVRARIAAQSHDRANPSAADIVVDNTGSLDELQENLDRIWAALTAR